MAMYIYGVYTMYTHISILLKRAKN